MTDLTREEQENGARVIRRWPKDEILSVVAMSPREREIVVLAASLLDLAPGQPVSRPEGIIELP